jgi:isopropylmalate/homocitrate/citramalate synthase
MVSEYSGIPIPINKAVVGPNAFRHESGIHVAAVMKCPFTYESYEPQLVGQDRKLVFGRHSGSDGVREKLKSFGLAISDEELADIVSQLKTLPMDAYLDNDGLADFAKKILAKRGRS